MPPRSRSRRRATSAISGPRISPPFAPMRSAASFADALPAQQWIGSAMACLAGQEPGNDRSRQLRKRVEALVDPRKLSIRDKDDVLVATPEFLWERVGLASPRSSR